MQREIAVRNAPRYPHIVHVNEMLSSSKHLYLAMDLVRGSELFDGLALANVPVQGAEVHLHRQHISAIDFCDLVRVYHFEPESKSSSLSQDINKLTFTYFWLASFKSKYPKTELLSTVMRLSHCIAPELSSLHVQPTAMYEGDKVDLERVKWCCSTCSPAACRSSTSA